MSYNLFRNVPIVANGQPQNHRELKCFSLDKVPIHYEKKMANLGAIDDKLSPSL